MTDTKENILMAALRLFAKDGYEAVSVSKIAGELGVTKGALYKHYKNKRDIFDSIVERMFQLDNELARKYNVPDSTFDNTPEQYTKIDLGNLKNFALSKYRFWTQDEFASNYRKMLTLEQYRNSELSKLFQDCLVSGPVVYLENIFREMVNAKVLKAHDPHQLALEFFAPLFLLINMYSEDSDFANEENKLVTHIEHFIECNTM